MSAILAALALAILISAAHVIAIAPGLTAATS